MNNLLHSIPLRELHNAEYIQLGEDVKKITDELAGAAPEVAPFARAFNERMAAIGAVFLKDPASPLTDPLVEADTRRDAAITGLGFVARGYCYSADPAKKAAGELLYHNTSRYGSGLADQNYATESASLSSLLADFRGQAGLASALRTLGVEDWAGELQAANDRFVALYQERTDAYGDASPDTVRSLRVAADAALRALLDKIAAYHSIADGAAPWGTYVSRLNALIDQYNTLIASHPPGQPRKGRGGQS